MSVGTFRVSILATKDSTSKYWIKANEHKKKSTLQICHCIVCWFECGMKYETSDQKTAAAKHVWYECSYIQANLSSSQMSDVIWAIKHTIAASALVKHVNECCYNLSSYPCIIPGKIIRISDSCCQLGTCLFDLSLSRHVIIVSLLSIYCNRYLIWLLSRTSY